MSVGKSKTAYHMVIQVEGEDPPSLMAMTDLLNRALKDGGVSTGLGDGCKVTDITPKLKSKSVW